MDEPMPGAQPGNRPRALRFRPGIRLDWSCEREGNECHTEQNADQSRRFALLGKVDHLIIKMTRYMK